MTIDSKQFIPYICMMGIFMSIDFGEKRCGLAVTDSLNTCAFALETVPTKKIFEYLNDFFEINKPEIFVIGEPKQKDNSNSQIESLIKKFSIDFKKQFPTVKVHRHDERFTSKIAKRFLINAGAKRKIRHNKSIIDKISATIILQDFLDKYKKI